MGKRVVLVGGTGAGQITKACNQIVVGLTMEAVAEALVLGAKAGVDPAKIREVLLGGFAQSRILELHGQRMIDRNFAPGFKVKLHRKDLGIALSAGKAYGVPLPLTAQVHEMLNALVVGGHGDDDHSSLATFIEGLAGHSIGRRALANHGRRAGRATLPALRLSPDRMPAYVFRSPGAGASPRAYRISCSSVTWIALSTTGQASSQMPQPLHLAGFTKTRPWCGVAASVGQASTHTRHLTPWAQARQRSRSTRARPTRILDWIDDLDGAHRADLGAQVGAAPVQQAAALARRQVGRPHGADARLQQRRLQPAGGADAHALLAEDAGGDKLVLGQGAGRPHDGPLGQRLGHAGGIASASPPAATLPSKARRVRPATGRGHRGAWPPAGAGAGLAARARPPQVAHAERDGLLGADRLALQAQGAVGRGWSRGSSSAGMACIGQTR